MPWTKKQIDTAKVALACKRGEINKSELNKAALSMYNSMTEGQLKEFISEGVKE